MIKDDLDDYDMSILRCLQENANISMQELSDKIGLSKTPCWKRVKKMHFLGYIRKTIAIISPEKLGLNTRIIVALQTSAHNLEWLDYFSQKILSMPYVVRFYRLTGVSDYHIELLLPSLKAYDDFYKSLLSIDDVTKVTSSMVLEEIKEYGIIG